MTRERERESSPPWVSASDLDSPLYCEYTTTGVENFLDCVKIGFDDCCVCEIREVWFVVDLAGWWEFFFFFGTRSKDSWIKMECFLRVGCLRLCRDVAIVKDRGWWRLMVSSVVKDNWRMLFYTWRWCKDNSIIVGTMYIEDFMIHQFITITMKRLNRNWRSEKFLYTKVRSKCYESRHVFFFLKLVY